MEKISWKIKRNKMDANDYEEVDEFVKALILLSESRIHEGVTDGLEDYYAEISVLLGDLRTKFLTKREEWEREQGILHGKQRICTSFEIICDKIAKMEEKIQKLEEK